MEALSNNQPQIAGLYGTKLAIFRAAVDLFSAKGYANVGIRDIAKAVGIKSSSLYNHFENKEAIAKEMYNFFYYAYYDKTPFLEDVLEKIPDITPEEALDQLLPPCEGPVVYDIIMKIVSVAVMERNNNPEAGKLVTEIFARSRKRISAVLEKFLELDLIEPINIEMLITVFVNFGLSPTSFANNLDAAVPFEEWRDGRRLLFSLVRLKNQK